MSVWLDQLLTEFQPLQSLTVPPSFQQLEARDRPSSVDIGIETMPFAGITFVVVVTRCAFGQELRATCLAVANGVDPRGFALCTGFQYLSLSAPGGLQEIGNMTSLLIKHVREVDGQRVLGQPHEKAVGKTMTHDAVQ